jgi:hypothetical protein
MSDGGPVRGPSVFSPVRGIDALETTQLGRTRVVSTGKRKTTMAKLNRERRLQERRLEKKAKKEARKRASADDPGRRGDMLTGDEN